MLDGEHPREVLKSILVFIPGARGDVEIGEVAALDRPPRRVGTRQTCAVILCLFWFFPSIFFMVKYTEHKFVVLTFCVCVVLGIKPGASRTLGKCFTSEVQRVLSSCAGWL